MTFQTSNPVARMFAAVGEFFSSLTPFPRSKPLVSFSDFEDKNDPLDPTDLQKFIRAAKHVHQGDARLLTDALTQVHVALERYRIAEGGSK